MPLNKRHFYYRLHPKDGEGRQFVCQLTPGEVPQSWPGGTLVPTIGAPPVLNRDSPQSWLGGYPRSGVPPVRTRVPPLARTGYFHPGTGYAAGGIPLAVLHRKTFLFRFYSDVQHHSEGCLARAPYFNSQRALGKDHIV